MPFPFPILLLLVLSCLPSQAQLYPVAVTVVPYAAAIPEGGSLQMTARLVYNNGGSAPIEPSRVQWRVNSVDPAYISSTGMLIASAVHKDTQITIHAVYAGYQGFIPAFIRNTQPDNYGSYAGDGLEDGWQVEHFGLDHPQASPLSDPDGDEQNNLFEYTAGTSPRDRYSKLVFAVLRAPSQPTHRKIEIHPILADRAYQLQHSPDLTPASWKPVAATPVDTGSHRVITDTDAAGASRFYRVIVTKP
ncbi:hypothetical protein OVA24_14445 [Luteolibacter sp. SL250]|uniref:hypothetical protein n=1 Tax=Luteolibacter sp. SL250 TaxID=2995170 RepID=UPI00226F20E5|nr:hypothetical protein [Luteolibacter sp. SL250]WAC18431.1 hypothetical protein OVA24_14445 [Luteolibacter sp. SL250]